MLLGLPPARYVVLPHYQDKLKQLLETANDVDAGLPLEYEVTVLEVGCVVYRVRGGCMAMLEVRASRQPGRQNGGVTPVIVSVEGIKALCWAQLAPSAKDQDLPLLYPRNWV